MASTDISESLRSPSWVPGGNTIGDAFLLVAVSLLIWRVWRFTIYPSLHPNEPRNLPYWVPVLGHGFAFFNNSHTLITKSSKYFGNTREPFALTAFGSTFYIISKPKDTVDVYKNTESLSFEEFLVSLMSYLGLSADTLDAVFRTRLPKTKPGFPNPDGKALGHFVREMHHRQLFPGHNLDQLEKTMIDWFDTHLDIPVLQNLCSSYSSLTSGSSLDVPLVKWCSELFTRAGEIGYFGDTLESIEPDMATIFLEYDDLSWQVLYQYPKLFSREMHAALSRIQDVFMRYFEVPRNQRRGGAWFTTAIEDECNGLGIDRQNKALFMATVYWVVSTNTRKSAFWLLYHVLRNPSLIAEIRAETAPAFQGDSINDVNHIHNHCPKLEQIWYETLRLSSNSASARIITQDTVIGGRLLRKGNRILVPYRLLHFNEEVFGSDVDSFRPERFEGRADKLTKGPSWRPFGGGKTMCPGHHIAKRETMAFVAMVLRRFDVELIDSSSVLEPDLCRPVLGLADRKLGQDVMVRISQRKLA
ncbi:putative cytochrome p450 [Xylariaceae sp. FL1019]|nr:putative cytochrome p450 [Xylariaceae sp. FL1019]